MGHDGMSLSVSVCVCVSISDADDQDVDDDRHFSMAGDQLSTRPDADWPTKTLMTQYTDAQCSDLAVTEALLKP